MNRIQTISAIAMFAVVLSMSAISPALAAANDSASEQGKKASNAGKINICHWQEEVIDDTDPDNPVVIEEAQWVVINVSRNAEDAHIGVHTDDTDFDEEIGEDLPLPDDTACTDRNI